MANDTHEIDNNIETIKSDVRSSFARIYATLRARELKTLRQLDAICKQTQDIKDFNRNKQNVRICFDTEPDLIENINKYGAIDFELLNLESSTFIIEDYINPENDHMYLYKDISNLEDLAIEEAALKQITATENCVCYVNIRSEDVSKKFRDSESLVTQIQSEASKNNSVCQEQVECKETVIDSIEEKSYSSDTFEIEIKKIDPTDDWLNSIKNQIETEPSQNIDVMEHSKIACS